MGNLDNVARNVFNEIQGTTFDVRSFKHPFDCHLQRTAVGNANHSLPVVRMIREILEEFIAVGLGTFFIKVANPRKDQITEECPPAKAFAQQNQGLRWDSEHSYPQGFCHS